MLNRTTRLALASWVDDAILYKRKNEVDHVHFDDLARGRGYDAWLAMAEDILDAAFGLFEDAGERDMRPALVFWLEDSVAPADLLGLPQLDRLMPFLDHLTPPAIYTFKGDNTLWRGDEENAIGIEINCLKRPCTAHVYTLYCDDYDEPPLKYLVIERDAKRV